MHSPCFLFFQILYFHFFDFQFTEFINSIDLWSQIHFDSSKLTEFLISWSEFIQEFIEVNVPSISICLTLLSSSSNRFDLLFLYCCNLSLWILRVSSWFCIFEIIFSHVAKLCWVKKSSCLIIFSLFSDTDNCSHKY